MEFSWIIVVLPTILFLETSSFPHEDQYSHHPKLSGQINNDYRQNDYPHHSDHYSGEELSSEHQSVFQSSSDHQSVEQPHNLENSEFNDMNDDLPDVQFIHVPRKESEPTSVSLPIERPLLNTRIYPSHHHHRFDENPPINYEDDRTLVPHDDPQNNQKQITLSNLHDVPKINDQVIKNSGISDIEDQAISTIPEVTSISQDTEDNLKTQLEHHYGHNLSEHKTETSPLTSTISNIQDSNEQSHHIEYNSVKDDIFEHQKPYVHSDAQLETSESVIPDNHESKDVLVSHFDQGHGSGDLVDNNNNIPSISEHNDQNKESSSLDDDHVKLKQDNDYKLKANNPKISELLDNFWRAYSQEPDSNDGSNPEQYYKPTTDIDLLSPIKVPESNEPITTIKTNATSSSNTADVSEELSQNSATIEDLKNIKQSEKLPENSYDILTNPRYQTPQFEDFVRKFLSLRSPKQTPQSKNNEEISLPDYSESYLLKSRNDEHLEDTNPNLHLTEIKLSSDQSLPSIISLNSHEDNLSDKPLYTSFDDAKSATGTDNIEKTNDYNSESNNSGSINEDYPNKNDDYWHTIAPRVPTIQKLFTYITPFLGSVIGPEKTHPHSDASAPIDNPGPEDTISIKKNTRQPIQVKSEAEDDNIADTLESLDKPQSSIRTEDYEIQLPSASGHSWYHRMPGNYGIFLPPQSTISNPVDNIEKSDNDKYFENRPQSELTITTTADQNSHSEAFRNDNDDGAIMNGQLKDHNNNKLVYQKSIDSNSDQDIIQSSTSENNIPSETQNYHEFTQPKPQLAPSDHTYTNVESNKNPLTFKHNYDLLRDSDEEYTPKVYVPEDNKQHNNGQFISQTSTENNVLDSKAKPHWLFTSFVKLLIPAIASTKTTTSRSTEKSILSQYPAQVKEDSKKPHTSMNPEGYNMPVELIEKFLFPSSPKISPQHERSVKPNKIGLTYYDKNYSADLKPKKDNHPRGTPNTSEKTKISHDDIIESTVNGTNSQNSGWYQILGNFISVFSNGFTAQTKNSASIHPQRIQDLNNESIFNNIKQKPENKEVNIEKCQQPVYPIEHKKSTDNPKQFQNKDLFNLFSSAPPQKFELPKTYIVEDKNSKEYKRKQDAKSALVNGLIKNFLMPSRVQKQEHVTNDKEISTYARKSQRPKETYTSLLPVQSIISTIAQSSAKLNESPSLAENNAANNDGKNNFNDILNNRENVNPEKINDLDFLINLFGSAKKVLENQQIISLT